MSKLDDLVKSIERIARSPGDLMAHVATAAETIRAYRTDAEHFYAGTRDSMEHVRADMSRLSDRIEGECSRRAGSAAGELFELLSDEVRALRQLDGRRA